MDRVCGAFEYRANRRINGKKAPYCCLFKQGYDGYTRTDSDGNIIEETYKTVDYVQLIGLLVEGIKELQKEVIEIKAGKK